MAGDDLDALLLKRRIVQMRGPINSTMYANLVDRLLTLNARSSKPIRILIDSRGGDVDLALAIHDIIRSLSCITNGLVIGECSSSALAVLQACTQRLAFAHAQFMFHAPKTTHTFQINRRIHRVARSWAQHSLRLPSAMRTILLKRSGMRSKDLKKLEQIGDELNLMIGSKTMLEFGVVDQICEGLTDCA